MVSNNVGSNGYKKNDYQANEDEVKPPLFLQCFDSVVDVCC